MNCADRGPDLVARHLGELETAPLAELESHLAACAPCRTESAQLTAILDESRALPQVAPSATVWNDLRQAVAEEERVGTLLTALALGQLEGSEESEARELVASNSERGAELRAIETLLEGARSAPQIAPSPRVLQRLRQAVRDDDQPESGDPDVDGDHVPAPIRRNGRPLRLLSWLLPAAAAAAVLVALSLNGAPEPGLHVVAGQLLIRPANGQPVSEDWVTRSNGPVHFGVGDELQAHEGAVQVRVRCDGEPATNERPHDEPPAGVVDLELGPGARLERLARREFRLTAGGVEVHAGQFGGSKDKRLTVRHGDSAVLVEGTRFHVATVGARLAVHVFEGSVRLVTSKNAKGVIVKAGEAGLADGTRAHKQKATEGGSGHGHRNFGGLLAPRLGLTLPKAKITRSGRLRIDAVLATGPGGAVQIVPFADSDAILAVRLKGPGASPKTVKLLESMLRTTADPPARDLRGSAGQSRLLEPDRPYRLEFDLPRLDLEPGTWEVVLMYTSYRKHSRGVEWLGVVESAPARLEVTE